MSSSTYSAYLSPDPGLRLIVINSGRLLTAIGFVLIFTLELNVLMRAVAAVAWGALSYLELRQLRRGFNSCVAIRVLPGGAILLRNRDGEWIPADLLTGSVLLQRFGWLRLRSADGCRFAELISGDSRTNRQWRHLQVIWRHIGATV